MRFATIFHTLGIFLMIFSLSMWPPFFIALSFESAGWVAFFVGFLITFITGFFLWFPVRNVKKELRVRDGFVIVVLFWIVLGAFAALPLMIVQYPHLSFTEAVFEAISGLTTTGATILTEIDTLPHAVVYYRQQLEFLGGMGIVLLAVAILPVLGIGGLQLYQAETSGLAKDNKLTPRITQTAKALWSIYVGLALLCALAYWLAGMEWFDAICESFGTISTGGFSVHDTSLAYYDSPHINAIAMVFMILGSINFSLHFFALQRKTLWGYWQDQELKVYIKMMLVSSLVIASVLIWYQVYDDPLTAVGNAVFTAVSFSTTTGYTTTPYYQWPSFLPLMLMMLAMVGGCAASTTGGIKVLRVLILSLQGRREFKRLIHPNAVFTIKLGDHVLSESVIQSVWGFVGVYTLLFLTLALVLMGTGLDMPTTLGALVASLSNTGDGLGAVALNFGEISATSKWVLIFSMLAGRLEIFTLLVLFYPAFWRP